MPNTTTYTNENIEGTTPMHTVTKSNEPNDTVVLLDWDDTIFPTFSRFWDPNTTTNTEELNALFSAICDTLIQLIQQFGSENIYIVTNGAALWIVQCTMKLLNMSNKSNNFMYILTLYNIPIISAKDLYSSSYPKNYTKWKELKFKQIINEHYMKFKNSKIKNANNKKANNNNKQFKVVSIGDSSIEYTASKNMVDLINKENQNIKQNNKILLHRIKLLGNPSIKSLIQQHALLVEIAKLFKTEMHEIEIDYEKEMKYFQKS